MDSTGHASDSTGHASGRAGHASGRARDSRTGVSAFKRSLLLWRLSFRACWVSLWIGHVQLLGGSRATARLLPAPMRRLRRLADRQRALAEQWSGRAFPAPYPRELPAGRTGDGAATGRTGDAATTGRTGERTSDPVTAGLALRARLAGREGQVWRDRRWAGLEPWVGGPLAFGPLALVLSGVWGLVTAAFGARLSEEWGNIWYLFVPVQDWPTAVLAGVLGALQFPLAVHWAAPRAVRLHEHWLRAMLAPSEGELRAEMAEMADRIDHLTTTRSAAVDTRMAEIRRIERDLHDGAQVRLVAMGMTLDAAEHLLESDPAAVRALLAEARENSAKALQELRDLVRGIHPPILADRGLADAVRSLALISPLRTEVDAQLPVRPEPPVESAAYFAVSEILANAAKHSGAERAWIDVRHEGDGPGDAGTLRVTVTDDGHGGADPARGGGLRGIEERLATFDGVLAVSSPPGGPTIVTLEVPCALSSPKTTSC
ncbi:histidine kinase [Streptomyces sp. NPDC052114]|uniref:sensor histidine kinase n=1 Tax=unclassified Streptomyces TaxID=2593676 RepID=UPI00342B2D51